ncbi:MAG: hypothetical protein C0184_09260 [Chloroflexus aggregans]|uniref:Uncharacterized protein n=1 Tax=Chloroflexus aggregans TaxID=152260 RepID=A0A2J6X3Q6_9CHLR|nr:MAG: hypothetical protein C0184_09260 [Chloroflexus aggregans]
MDRVHTITPRLYHETQTVGVEDGYVQRMPATRKLVWAISDVGMGTHADGVPSPTFWHAADQVPSAGIHIIAAVRSVGGPL